MVGGEENDRLFARAAARDMVPHCYMVHGLHTRNEGSLRTVALRARIRGVPTTVLSYGWLSLIGAGICNDNLADLLADVVPPGSLGVGHSNGCSVLHEACKLGAPFDRLIYINPALDRDLAPPKQVKRLDVWANSRDIWPRLSSLFPFSSWGSMGTDGYVGTDARVFNHYHRSGHSGVLHDRKLQEMLLDSVGRG
jgi:hypothetical protein